jgi:Sigma-54 interaction domain
VINSPMGQRFMAVSSSRLSRIASQKGRGRECSGVARVGQPLRSESHACCRDKVGHLELAAGGTLFVDGIAEMNPTLQAKLLRVLQEGWFERVGDTETLPTDARIIAAATPELERLISA